MEKRADDEPKFNPKNKTDRKIVLTVSLLSFMLLLLIGGLIAVYLLFFR